MTSGRVTVACVLLALYNPDVIKLNDGRVRGNWRGDNEMPVLRRLVALCSALAPCVVAEGIECEEDLLKSLPIGD